MSTRSIATARLDKAQLFKLLGYAPHATQARCHASAARIRVLAAGSRFGKSVAATMELLAAALAPGPDARLWIVAPHFDVVDKLLALLVAQLSGGLAHRVLEEARRDRRVVLRNLTGNHAVIEGRTAERVASLLGESIDYLLVDEAGRIDDAVWEGALAQRLVQRDGRAMIVGTPRAENSWFHRLFLEGQDPNVSDVESWTGRSTDNPLIDPAIIERERARLSLAEFSSEHLGLFVGPDGPCCLTCGGPNRGCATTVILLPGETLQHCATCSRPLDREGRPVGVAHGSGTYVLTLTTDDVKPPEVA
jgi:hypothetical protein